MTEPLPRFPVVRWSDEAARFVPEPSPTRPFAALVFPFYGDKVVLAEIVGRGWCVPSGRLEPGESAEDAARREAREEAGVMLGTLVPLGHYVLTRDDGGERRAAVFVGSVDAFEPVPEGSESRGRQLLAIEDVAGAYYAWDDLLGAVFAYAWEVKDRRLRPGIALSEWMAPP